jgi:hypothetical protein
MLRISVTRALPPRSRRLAPEELQRVFGGSGASCDGSCQSYKDCCDGYACNNNKCEFTSYMA